MQGSPDANSIHFHPDRLTYDSTFHPANHWSPGMPMDFPSQQSMTPRTTPHAQSAPWKEQLPGTVTGSFMQRFDDAHLSESFSNTADMPPATPAFPLRTPPPTRGSSKRKPQQPRFAEVSTPPTIRHAPPPSLSAAPGPSPYMSFDASPFPFSPLHFSPHAPGFAPSGPVTAPAQQQHVFWDPNAYSSIEPAFSGFQEDPFVSQPAVSQSFNFSSPMPVNHRYAASESFPQPPPIHRPQTARPSTALPMKSPPSVINPSMLYTNQSSFLPSQRRQTVSEARPLAPPTRTTPYATQKELLQREKADKLRRTSGRPGLQRSATESQLISRSESPLKRQKSNAHPPLSVSPTKPREVVLEIDEHGHASTKVVGEPLRPGRYSVSPLAVQQEEDTEDDDVGSEKAVSDAGAAIRQIRKR